MGEKNLWEYLSKEPSAYTFESGDSRVSVVDVSRVSEEVWRDVRDEFLEEHYRNLWGSDGVPDAEKKTRGVMDEVRRQEEAFCLLGIEHGNGERPTPVANYTAFSPYPGTLQELHYPSEVRVALEDIQASGLEAGYDFHLVVHPDRRGRGIGKFVAGIGQALHQPRDVTVATIRYGDGDTPIYRLATEHFDYDHTGMWFDGGRTAIMYREHRPLDTDLGESFPSRTSSESV